MAYESLKSEIRQYIKTNGHNEITGQILQDVLIDMVNQYPSLDGYATQQWVESQGYISEADLTNYATQSWVGQNFLSLIGGTMTGDLTFTSGNGISVYYQYGEEPDVEYDTIDIRNGVISVGNAGDITIGGNSVWHAGNLNPSNYMLSSTAVINSVTGDELGHLTLTGPNFSATVLDFSHQHRWEELIDVPTNLRDLGITEEYLPLSAGSTKPLTGDLYMSIDDDTFIIEHSLNKYKLTANNIWIVAGLDYKFGNLFEIGDNYDNYIRLNSTSIKIGYWDVDDGDIDQVVIQGNGITIDGNAVATQNWVSQQGYITSSALIGYATQSWVGQNYLPLTGGVTVSGNVTFSSILTIRGSNYGYADFFAGPNGLTILTANLLQHQLYVNGNTTVTGNITASSFIKDGGTSSQFLKADGSVDSNTYMLSSTAVINSVVGDELGHLTLTGPNFSATVLDFSHQHRWEELIDRPLIDMWNDTMVAVNGIVSSGRIGAGVSSTPSYMLEVNGQTMLYYEVGIGTAPSSGISLDIDGTARAGSFVNNSDIRKKDVIEYDVDPGFETIANAPTIRFTWKDRGLLDNRVECVGSIAQYWQRALPEAVMTDGEGYLSMQYDVIALIAAVSVAKRVASHEQRIEELERENALLRMDIKALKGEA